MSKRSFSPDQSDRSVRIRTVPTEEEAIKMFLQGQTVNNDYLNQLLINPYDGNIESFHERNFIRDLPEIITPRDRIIETNEWRRQERYGLYLEGVFGDLTDYDFFLQFGIELPEYKRTIPYFAPYDTYAIDTPQRVGLFYQHNIKNIFEGFNWNNVVIAGGFALFMLNGYQPDNTSHQNDDLPDIDLFIYGMNEEQGYQKIQEMIEFFRNKDPNQSPARFIIRTERAITIGIPESKYPIQIILRLYQHPTEILLGFDLPCVKVLFNGTNFFMTQSAQVSIVQRCNIANGVQPFRTGSYEYRLMKYFRRGYDISVVNFQPNQIDPKIFSFEFDHILQLRGLARLLFMLKYNKNLKRNRQLIGDYDPLSSAVKEMVMYLWDDGNIRHISNLKIIYDEKPFFLVEFQSEYWNNVLTGQWNPNRAFRSSSEHKPVEVGPLRFIGSLTEYLQSLPNPGTWYCQAYGIKESECNV